MAGDERLDRVSGKRSRGEFSPERSTIHEDESRPKRQRVSGLTGKERERSKRMFGKMLFGTLKGIKETKPTEKENKRMELDTRIQATIDAERKEAMEEEEKKREERKKKDQEFREQQKMIKERRRLIFKRNKMLKKFERDREFLKTDITGPYVLWIPGKHNEKTQKMLEERKNEEFKEPFPEIIPYLDTDDVSLQIENSEVDSSPTNSPRDTDLESKKENEKDEEKDNHPIGEEENSTKEESNEKEEGEEVKAE